MLMKRLESVDFFFTVTPMRCTSCDNLAIAVETRFWVNTLAISRSVPVSKVTVRPI